MTTNIGFKIGEHYYKIIHRRSESPIVTTWEYLGHLPIKCSQSGKECENVFTFARACETMRKDPSPREERIFRSLYDAENSMLDAEALQRSLFTMYKCKGAVRVIDEAPDHYNTNHSNSTTSTFRDAVFAGTSVDLQKMLQRQPELTDIVLYPPVTRDHIEIISNLHHLVSVTILYSNATYDDLSPLRKLRRLRRLDITDGYVSDEVIEIIENMKRLRTISLAGTYVTDSICLELQGLPELMSINLSRTAISNSAGANIARIPTLRMLDVNQTAVDDEFVCALTNHRSIQQIGLRRTSVTNDIIRPLASIMNLECLDLRFTKVTEEILTGLESFRQLRFLQLRGVRIALAELMGFMERRPDIVVKC